MSAPSAPIDSDLVEASRDVLYVIEEASVWKTENLSTAGAATWTEVWIEGALLGGTLGALCRIRCAPGSATLVYVLGWGEKADGKNYPFVLRSETAGMTWSEHWLDEEIEEVESPYTIVGTISKVPGPLHDGTGYSETFVKMSETKFSLYVWKNKTVDFDTGVTYYIPLTGWTETPAFPTKFKARIIWSSRQEATPRVPRMHFGPVSYTEGSDEGADIYKFDPVNTTFPPIYNTIGEGVVIPTVGNVVAFTFEIVEVEGIPVSSSSDWLTGFDVARTNGGWLYVGMADKIMKSEDGGYTWDALTEDYGAYDICVDPQAGGAIYFADTEGNIRLMVAGIDQGALTTETATRAPLRIARDINTGKLWVLKSGTTLAMRESGSWADKKTGLTAARGLHSYIGGKLIFVEASGIYISDDYGTTVTAKTGGWATYASGLNAHRIVVLT